MSQLLQPETDLLYRLLSTFPAMLSGYMVKSKEVVLKCPVRIRFHNVVLYSKGDGMLNACHCLSPARYEQDWHSLSSALVTFLHSHDGKNEVVSL